MTFLEQAKCFATRKHEGQKRKVSGLPYIVHPEHVANMIHCYYGFDENLLAAAWLHDTLEDTDTSYEELQNEFGHDVAKLVLEVTNQKLEVRGRAAKWQLRLAHIKEASTRAKALKLADRLCNLINYYVDWDYMETHEKYFVKNIYIQESKDLLETCKYAHEFLAHLLRVQIDLLERKVSV